jgi:hypothetical protein
MMVKELQEKGVMIPMSRVPGGSHLVSQRSGELQFEASLGK